MAPPPRSPYDDQDKEDDQDLTALGFLFDAAAAKAWVKHSFHTSTSSPSSQSEQQSSNDDQPNDSTPVIEVEVQVIDDEDGPGALQTGQRTWPAAPFMANYLVQNWARIAPAAAANRRQYHVLELGAGCGLLGLTLVQLPGIETVIMTDHDPGTLVLIREGIKRNQARLREGVRCEAALVEWGSEVDERLLPTSRRGRTEKKEGTEERPVLVIVGSDLIYSLDVVASLFETVAGMLRKGAAAAAAAAAAVPVAEAAAAGAGAETKFMLCGSFGLGEAIDKKVNEVVAQLTLKRTVMPLGEVESKEMWMHVYTLP